MPAPDAAFALTSDLAETRWPQPPRPQQEASLAALDAHGAGARQ